MRLSGFSMIGLLAALAIVAVLMLNLLGSSSSINPSGTGTTQGSLGSYANAISNARQSAAQQNAAAAQASGTSAP